MVKWLQVGDKFNIHLLISTMEGVWLMSFVHYDEIYDICCEAYIHSEAKTEPKCWKIGNTHENFR